MCREKELARLDAACADAQQAVLLLHAPGGTGKTALLKHWLGRLQEKQWNGFRKIFGWSFYSQGSSEERQASSEAFLHAALRFFGDPAPEQGTARDKARRLAQWLKAEKNLLILDGLEPLQQSAPPPGKIRDAGLQTLLADLTSGQPGLLVAISRLEIRELKGWPGVAQESLESFSAADGAALLAALKVWGSETELQNTAREFGGHGLALVLLASWLNMLRHGDARCRREVALLDAADVQYFGGHAQRVIRSYEQFFGENSAEIAFLRVLSLFDKPVARAELEVLFRLPPIKGLTDGLGHLEKRGGFLGFFQRQAFVFLDEAHWALMVENLQQARLLLPAPSAQATLFDTHPLIREHFAASLKADPSAWQEGNRRLYEFYKTSAKPLPETSEEMQPLYAAVTHGCRAGLQQAALEEVFWKRIWRGEQFYSIKKLGLLGSDLAALAGMFETQWITPAASLREDDQSFVLNHAAVCLRALGRLREALVPMRAGEERYVAQENWKNAARSASGLSEIQLTLGDLAEAEASARRGVDWADKSGDAFQRMSKRTTLADALRWRGEFAAARALFVAAEQMQQEWQPDYPLLYSLRGYQYCDCLLAEAEQKTDNLPSKEVIRERACQVRERAEKTLDWVANHFTNMGILDSALDHLSLARALALEAGGKPPPAQRASIQIHFDQAVQGLRDSGDQDMLTIALIHRAHWHRQQGEQAQAERDWQEARQIAELGEMGLFLALINRSEKVD